MFISALFPHFWSCKGHSDPPERGLQDGKGHFSRAGCHLRNRKVDPGGSECRLQDEKIDFRREEGGWQDRQRTFLTVGAAFPALKSHPVFSSWKSRGMPDTFPDNLDEESRLLLPHRDRPLDEVIQDFSRRLCPGGPDGEIDGWSVYFRPSP